MTTYPQGTEPAQVLVPPPTDSCPDCGHRRNTAYHVTPPEGEPPGYVCHYVCPVCDHYWATSWLLSALGAA